MLILITHQRGYAMAAAGGKGKKTLMILSVPLALYSANVYRLC